MISQRIQPRIGLFLARLELRAKLGEAQPFLEALKELLAADVDVIELAELAGRLRR